MSLMKMNILIFVFLLISSVNTSPLKSRMPLLDHLRAPLVAELDVSDINKQLKEFIETQVTEEVNQTVVHNIDETITLEMLEVKKLFKNETLELKDKMVRDQKDLESTMVLNYTDAIKKMKDYYEREFANYIKRSESRFDKPEQNSTKEINKMKAVITELPAKINGLGKADCADIQKYHKSGVYHIFPDREGFKVYCDMDTDGGGWTVFQRRINGNTNFYRNWTDYKNGFGDLQTEFWLGNEHLYILTSNGKYELRIDIEDFNGNKAYAKYSSFAVGNEANKYKLAISGYSGNASDSLTYNNGEQFTTKDQDNDSSSGNCAVIRKGAWWYRVCGYSNLNGVYVGNKINTTGISWYYWKNNWQSMKTTTMMIRRTD